MVVSEKTTEVS